MGPPCRANLPYISFISPLYLPTLPCVSYAESKRAWLGLGLGLGLGVGAGLGLGLGLGLGSRRALAAIFFWRSASRSRSC